MVWTIAIAGRPNVGKSTLFNRLCPPRRGQSRALVSPAPGLTRDWREGEARLGNLRFRLIDTAGLEEARAGSLAALMTQGAQQTLRQADLCLFLIDARAGLTPADERWALYLRRHARAVVPVANKCEGRAGDAGWLEAHRLGFGAPVALSAEHGEGLSALAQALEDVLPQTKASEEENPDRPLRLAVVGRPNAGKSTLINRLLGRNRVLAGPKPGTTRDAVAVAWRWREHDVLLFDTAGLRRRARISEKDEALAAGAAVEAIRFADVVVLLMEADAAFEKQDLQIADLIAREGRAAVFALNKIDLAPAIAVAALRRKARALLPQLRGAALVPLSALTGAQVETLMPACLRTGRVWNREIATGPLNRRLQEALRRHPPPAPQGRPLRIKYIVQTSARPPSFTLFASRPRAFPESYRRYLTNELRAGFALWGTPIRLRLRASRNPYAPGA